MNDAQDCKDRPNKKSLAHDDDARIIGARRRHAAYVRGVGGLRTPSMIGRECCLVEDDQSISGSAWRHPQRPQYEEGL